MRISVAFAICRTERMKCGGEEMLDYKLTSVYHEVELSSCDACASFFIFLFMVIDRSCIFLLETSAKSGDHREL